MHSNVIEQRMQEAHEDFAARGQAVADVLNAEDIQGGGWTAEAGVNVYGSFTLHHPAGFAVHVARLTPNLSGAAGRRLTVDGHYPREFYGDRAPTIGVGLDQPAAWLARRIVTRFLPGYLNVWPKAMLHKRLEKRQTAARTRLNARLEHALPALGPGAVGGGPDRLQSYGSVAHQVEGERTTCRVKARMDNPGTTVDLQLDWVPADLAVRILQVLNPASPLEGRIMPGPRALGAAPEAITTPRILVGEVVHGARTQRVQPQLSSGRSAGERAVFEPWFAPSRTRRPLQMPREAAVHAER
ncbi:hypothetical protein [Streptomyces sp. WM6378]|uniref:hypothetical protein n=1 Tax=Streptomyces sp. WM6378 TaxID=1415557 RepID=UPI000A3F762E|nr:hypothetical protein [Streptomyces sp. WM6378]